MDTQTQDEDRLSPWWRNAVILIMIVGFSILIGLTVRSYRDAPPIPDQVVGPIGEVVFTGADVRAGQQVFLKYGLMENGSIWGHGAYLGPDFSAAYLHDLGGSRRQHCDGALWPALAALDAPVRRPSKRKFPCFSRKIVMIPVRIY